MNTGKQPDDTDTVSPLHATAPVLLEALKSLLADHLAMSKEKTALRGHNWAKLPIQKYTESVIAKAEGKEPAI